MLRAVSRCSLLLVICLLFACGTPATAPIEDLGQPSASTKTYVVQKGDTLFSIAWRFNLDYKRLAAANNIPPPYVIRSQQRILLTEVPAKKPAVKGSAGASKNTVNRAPKPVSQKETKNIGNNSKIGVEEQRGPSKTVNAVSNEGWIWPVKGKVVRFFSPQDNLSKGIDISAADGTPIVSSRSGEVIYAGSQLKGYGNLIIIRHDDEYLSAYAHNRVILVKEGQSIKQGEKIAELGSSGTQSPKLHFEIRQQGKPVNPLQFLTKK